MLRLVGLNDFYDAVAIAVCAAIMGAALHSVWAHWQRGVVQAQLNKASEPTPLTDAQKTQLLILGLAIIMWIGFVLIFLALGQILGKPILTIEIGPSAPIQPGPHGVFAI